ncbi:MAG: PqqD family protein [Gemmatimonadota bacterium]|nr:MAG: PqqD family protein [Gemmatimonadota bacterium]
MMVPPKNTKGPQPKFVEENLDYFREEKEGCFTFLSKQHPETQQLLLNRTGVEIKELCTGARTLEEIHAQLRARYSNVSSHTLRQDINNVIRSFWKLGLIEWIGSNPFSKMYAQKMGNTAEAYVATEEDVGEIVALLQKFGIPKEQEHLEHKKPFYENPVFPRDGYDETVIRQKIFFNTEGFFVSCEDHTLTGLVSLTFPNAWLPDRTTIIGLMLKANGETPVVFFSKLFDFAVALLPSVLPPQIRCTKVKCLQLQDSENMANERILDFLSAKGFSEEAKFKDELGWGKDLQVFSRWMLA